MIYLTRMKVHSIWFRIFRISSRNIWSGKSQVKMIN